MTSEKRGHDCSVACVSSNIRRGNAAEGVSWQCQERLEYSK